jgi:g-D-glutamyl-meso-diaminopimelate peptidase
MPVLFLGSTGPDVMLLQSILNKLGFSAGQVDGIFGNMTRQAVIRFQRAFGLNPDGIVGPASWSALDRYLLGYDRYRVRAGDTLYRIAAMYYTTVNAIISANPGIDPDQLSIGQIITVPYGYDIVFTDVTPTYKLLEMQLQGLKARYPFIEVGTFGNSVMGKNLYYIRLGTGSNEVSYNATHHGNESICTPVLLKFVESYCKSYIANTPLRGFDIRELYNNASIFIIPMVNPDGTDLVSYWPNYPDPRYDQAAELNRTGLPLPLVWKANIRGVDLNLNYPALWELEKEQEIAEGVTGPAPRNFGGEAPLSEPESAAMVQFTREHDFTLVIAYHTQGQVIYWQFADLAPPESLEIANEFSIITGYRVETGPAEAAWAGYKDWFIQDFGRPGFTFECGLGRNPLPLSQFPQIYDENEGAMLLAAVI